MDELTRTFRHYGLEFRAERWTWDAARGTYVYELPNGTRASFVAGRLTSVCLALLGGGSVEDVLSERPTSTSPFDAQKENRDPSVEKTV